MTKKNQFGLTLSGGGAKGAAHIGVLKAIEERNIKIGVVSGTSAGAIVGSLFCNGYSSDEILDFYSSTPIFRPGYYTWKKPGILNTDALGKVLEPMFEKDSFEALQIPLSVVATDIERARVKVFNEGPLTRAVLASSSFPGVFAPVLIDEVLYSDGGILNNFPVDLIRQRCETLIGVNVRDIAVVDKKSLRSTFSLIQRVIAISTRSNSLLNYHDCDVVIAPPELSKFTTFDMFKMKKMYKIGYESACKQLDAFLEKLA